MAAAKNPSNKNKNTKAKTPVKTNSNTDISPEIDKIAAVFLGAFSVMLFLSLFGVSALLLDLLSDFVKGLVGIGFFLTPFAFAYSAIVFGFFKKEKRFISQTISVMFLPVAAGMWGHIIANGGNTYFHTDYFSVYVDGISYKSGGIISGTLSDSFTFLISVYGSIICLSLITVLIFLYIFRFSLRGLIGYLGIRHEQSKVSRDMEKLRKAELKDSENSRVSEAVSSSAGRNPGDINDYNIPLGNNKTRPDTPIGVFSIESKDPSQQSKNLRSFDIPLDSVKKTYDSTDPVKSPAPQFRSSGFPDLTIPKVSAHDYDLTPTDPDSEKDDTFEPGEIIYDFTEGDEDIIIGEIPLQSDDTKTTDIVQEKAADSKMSPGLKPGQAEKERQALNREKAKPPEYIKPPIGLLTEDTSVPNGASDDEIKSNAKRLLETLSSFNIDAKITNIIRGPSITRYEVQLRQGIRFSRLTALSEDIALSLAAQAVRIAAIPDKVSIGIEVPNKNVNTVYIRDCLASKEFSGNPSKVTFALGKDITGRSIVWDIAKLPHMLVAGTTGSGKSVCINSLIVSILYKASPDEVKLIMIDPKIIELGIYNGIPHLMIPVVTDPKKAAGALQWAVYEMMHRYKLLAELNVRSLFEYNAEVERRASLPRSEDDPVYEKLPQIIIVIDELADLMLSSPREVEEAICRIAQMARAAGMHLIIATQRPSADVITGLMKANIPSRIAFTVSSALESRIILDTQGAEKLVGRGDMLFSPIGATKPMRIQGCFITAGEIEAVVKHVQRYGSANYNTEIIDHIEKASENVGKKNGGNSAANQQESSSQSEEDYEDPLLNDAIDIVMENSQASASMLQRKLRLGYTRAARLIDIMEARGIVGSFEGSKPRQILISKDYWMEMKSQRNE